MPDDPWVIPPEARDAVRTCRRCERTFTPEEMRRDPWAWTPLRGGWRCSACTRDYEARIERLARKLIAEHERQRWLRADEHSPSAECVFCDVIRKATSLYLDRTR